MSTTVPTNETHRQLQTKDTQVATPLISSTHKIMGLEGYLEDGVQSTGMTHLSGTWLAEEPGAAALGPGPLHGAASTSGYRRNPRSNVYLRVRKTKI